jgi:tetratricopeptide (TPR) repeat protein
MPASNVRRTVKIPATIEQPSILEPAAAESSQARAQSVRTAILSADELLGSTPALQHSALAPPLHANSALVIPEEAIDTIEAPSEPPDPRQFRAEANAEPIWLESNSTQPYSPIDQTAFERPFTDARQDNFVSVPEHEAASDDVEPVFISDLSDTPQDWLAEAQQLTSEATSLEQLSDAARLCERVIASDPSSELANSAHQLAALTHNRRGELLAESNRQQDAIEEFDTAIAIDETCVEAIHNRAVTLAQQLNYDAALTDFNRVIELNPELAIAYRNRAELFAAQGKLSDAVADYSRAVNATPNDAELYRARAHALQSLGHYDRAIADLNHSIQLDPASANGLTQRGNIMAERGDFGHALADFRQAAAIDPQLADAQRSLAWLYATCPVKGYRDAEKALNAAEQAVKLSGSTDYFALEALAAAQANAGQFDAAVETQRQAANAAPAQVAEALRQRVALYEKQQPFRSQILKGTASDE